MTTATFALLIDGSTVEIRQAGPQDCDAVREMHAKMSPENLYLRFFSLSPANAEREAQRVCREPGPDHMALLARLDGELCGVASYELTADPGVAEIAFAVPDHLHGRGIATLLLEHLVSIARQQRLEAFTAETLGGNTAMLSVFAGAGLPVRRTYAGGDVQLTFPLPGDEADQSFGTYLDSVAARESRADVASLGHLLRPASIAVIGASRRRGSPGREILHNIVTGGFGGQVYVVHPRARCMEGLHCLPSIEGLPEHVDLAVIAVPPLAVPQVAAQCGRRGARTLVVVTSGLGMRGVDLLAICRRHGMRLAGPGSFGVAVPECGLDATFAAGEPLAGAAGVVVQSGGVGMALLEHLSRLGIGVSSFASVGEKYDVSSNDLLTWWETDGQTRLAVLYVESFGSPRKFARTARRVGHHMPVLTVISAGPGTNDPAPCAPVTAAPLVTQEALFAQAGIIATHSLGELIEAAALLASQPLPAGERVAIIANAADGAMLAAGACAGNGLTVATISRPVQRRLTRLLPCGAKVTGPVITTAAAGVKAFRACLEEVAADPDVDSVLAIIVPTAIADLTVAVQSACVLKPFATAQLGQAPSVILNQKNPGEQPQPADAGELGRAVPSFAYPEAAARALGHAARYRAWRDRQQTRVPKLDDARPGYARELASAFLIDRPEGGWLPSAAVADLLSCYGIAVARPADEAGGVRVRIHVVHDGVFGPVVMFGLTGVAAEVPGDQAARLAPLTETDASDLLHSVHAAPALFGHGSIPGMDTGSLARLLVRISLLADEVPEIAELDLDPVIVRPSGVQPAGARIRICPARPQDPFLRQLR
jgi:acyl-CoA synthetase (NDP forming)/RimJ/RimL family protein N-acetyltransferase